MLTEIAVALVQTLFFFIPAAGANMAPVVFKSFPGTSWLKKPIDNGRIWNGRRLFGEHKTYFGFVSGVLFAMVLIALQAVLYTMCANCRWLFLADYSDGRIWFLGFLFGFGALFGDLIKSFIKRRVGIGDGKPFPPFDQLDSIIGGLVFASMVFVPPWFVWVILLLIGPFIHFLTNVAAYKVGIKRVWW